MLVTLKTSPSPSDTVLIREQVDRSFDLAIAARLSGLACGMKTPESFKSKESATNRPYSGKTPDRDGCNSFLVVTRHRSITWVWREIILRLPDLFVANRWTVLKSACGLLVDHLRQMRLFQGMITDALGKVY
jgi:hypothetical protein